VPSHHTTYYCDGQNGSILEALLLWKSNIEKRTAGVDECTICYSVCYAWTTPPRPVLVLNAPPPTRVPLHVHVQVIHSSVYQLPRLQCRTCRHKFHSACLYKWFQSATQSTCPLCRSEFS
jgi:hypothetical protein